MAELRLSAAFAACITTAAARFLAYLAITRLDVVVARNRVWFAVLVPALTTALAHVRVLHAALRTTQIDALTRAVRTDDLSILNYRCWGGRSCLWRHLLWKRQLSLLHLHVSDELQLLLLLLITVCVRLRALWAMFVCLYRQILAFHSDEVRSHVLTQSQKRTEGGAGCGAR